MQLHIRILLFSTTISIPRARAYINSALRITSLANLYERIAVPDGAMSEWKRRKLMCATQQL